MIFRQKIETLSDTELINQYRKNGDKQLVGVLYKRYTGFIFAVCMKHLRNRDISEDAVMQIFEKLFTDLQKHSVLNVKSWLYSVAKNHCLHIIRDRKKELTFDSDFINSTPHFMENSHSMYHDNEDVLEQKLEDLENEMHKLPEEQRVCIELFYLKQKSYNEVAAFTGYTLNQVKSYIQNGKRKLKISLTGDE